MEAKMTDFEIEFSEAHVNKKYWGGNALQRKSFEVVITSLPYTICLLLPFSFGE